MAPALARAAPAWGPESDLTARVWPLDVVTPPPGHGLGFDGPDQLLSSWEGSEDRSVHVTVVILGSLPAM